MSAGIISFLEKGTGPRALRSALQVKTKPLGALLQALGALNTVRTAVPRVVLGGDLLDLLSNRMRELLSYAEESRVAVDRDSAHYATFAEPSELERSPKLSFPANLESERSRLGERDELIPCSYGRDSFSTLPVSHSIRSLAYGFASYELQETTKPNALELQAIAHGAREPILTAPAKPLVRRYSGKPATSLLSEKLREYWELNQPQQASEKNSDQPTIAQERTEPPALSQPSWSPLGKSAPSWPEIAARQAAQRIPTSRAGAYLSRAEQTVQTSDPKKVEIQNIFNVEIGKEGDCGAGDSQDLSERIADILREQAIQHGIDIT